MFFYFDLYSYYLSLKTSFCRTNRNRNDSISIGLNGGQLRVISQFDSPSHFSVPIFYTFVSSSLSKIPANDHSLFSREDPNSFSKGIFW